jgi:putative membrane protein
MDKVQGIAQKQQLLQTKGTFVFQREVTKSGRFKLVGKSVKMSHSLILALAISCLLACNAANEHNTGGDSIHYIHDDTIAADTSLRVANFNDTAFVKLAGRYMLEDKEKAELVKRNAGSEEVKDFGMRILNDHKTALQQLKNLAIMRGIKLPEVVSGQSLQQIKKWTSIKGEAFDRAYMEDLVGFHEEVYLAFKLAALNATDGEISSFAVKNEPVLKKQLEEAKRLKKELNF